jgi:hypothetical protein
MTAKNDVTGDAIRSRQFSKKYADGWDRIFGKKDDADLGLEGDTREPKTQVTKQKSMTELNWDGEE